MGKNRKRPNHGASSLSDHQRFKNELRPPLAQLPTKPTPLQWTLHELPEFLLIDAVVADRSWRYAPRALEQFLDILDRFVPKESKKILLGTLSSLALVPESRRVEARRALDDTDFFSQGPVPEALWHGLALYPNSPAGWLLENWRQAHVVDWERGINFLKDAVNRLWYGHSVYATRCRMVPLARMFKHQMIFLPADVKDFELFPRYPTGLTEDEQRIVEATSRAMYAGLRATSEETPAWAAHFWRHSYTLSPCIRADASAPCNTAAEDATLPQDIMKQLEVLSATLKLEVERASQQANLDVFDPDRDEVLFGLLSRQFRLFTALSQQPELWTVDMGTIFHRAMADVLIQLTWYAQQIDRAIFSKFKEYSLGKQKLLKLHVQQLVDDGREDLIPLEKSLAQSINEEIFEELLTIDLGGNAVNMDMHKMAKAVGLQDLYNLTFAPSSATLHAEWTSLKQAHLLRCGNPLHRFHRLPWLEGPSVIAPDMVLHAGTMLVAGVRTLLAAYPEVKPTQDIDAVEKRLINIIAAL